MNPTDRLLQKMPFMRGLFADNDVQKINDRFAIFDGASISKEKKVQRLSTVNRYDYNLQNPSGGGYMAVSYYNQLMYSASSDNKKKRIDDYRSMANYPEVERPLREICKEFFVEDDRGKLLKFKLEGEHNSEVQLLLEDEFYSFIEELKLRDRGKKYIWDWLVEGELFFENIVSMQKPELGIIGFRRISSDRCDPLYYDLDNELIDTFILRNKSFDMYPFQIGYQHAQTNSHGPNHTNQILFLNEKQVTYVANDRWADGKKYRLPVLSYANRPYRQLSLIEDCTIIYMLARAPERLVFNIDVGNMNPSAADQHIRKLMSQFWAKKTLTNDGRIENMYDPQGITENFVFPKYNGGNGSSVESLAGGKSTPDNLEVLNIFVQKLYQSLRVPLGRLNSDTQYSDGEAISREELAFAEYIIDIQKMWAAAIKNAFIVHLKLKGKRLLESAKKLDIRDIVQNSET
ncbi:MAG TPA: portal protein, partial [Candidatus Dojkabacteria bacterium]|nr:portal protein [Candidatus Dojkabacteria bacterium]